MMDDGDIPYANTYWVERGKLLAGGSPRGRDDRETLANLRGLVGLGVTAIVDLSEEPEYLPVLNSSPSLAAVLQCVHFPAESAKTDPGETMRRILPLVEEAHSRGKAVFLHCPEADARGCAARRSPCEEGPSRNLEEALTMLRSREKDRG